MDPISFVQRLVSEWPVIAQAPASFLTAVVLMGGILWWLMHWRYGGQITLLKQQTDLYKSRLEQMEKGLHVLSSVSGVLAVEHHQSTWYWQVGQAEMQPFHPDITVPSGARRILRVWAKIVASLAYVECVELEVMGKRLQSHWEPMKVDLFFEPYVYVDIPASVNPGHYLVKLIVRANNLEKESAPFEIDVPRI